jgi:hypothetical protein
MSPDARVDDALVSFALTGSQAPKLAGERMVLAVLVAVPARDR